MKDEVSTEDVAFVIESLGHYKTHIENYQGYPSYEVKQQQMRRVEAIIAKMKALQNDLRENPA